MDDSASVARQRLVIRVLIGMLLLLIPVTGTLVYCGKYYWPRKRAVAAYMAMCDKGLDSNIRSSGDILFFKNGNVTDADLPRFLPAFSDAARGTGLRKIGGVRLNGSPVSKEALEKFRQAVPLCPIEP